MDFTLAFKHFVATFIGVFVGLRLGRWATNRLGLSCFICDTAPGEERKVAEEK